MSVVCTRISSVCHSYVLVCNGMSLVCTPMSFVYHLYVLVCHPYVTRCGFTMNRRNTINELFHGGNLSVYLVF